ncbi:molybdate transport system ATP-binding protein [Pseudochelatococcus lubricantis]|uniref:Molybdate transport system ATP-binding protein n=1 Tax=Pseudochelatococcus lubricantis TaxID=1538102 RepID=A0ABX0V3J3_9HYPH|nr:molybdenum ABC transporter ATP-binding protein [Pseudochelatococcus lubricantis]NIJ59786.1 molybdate transport system ATP-binding protein [Pseudochelatococcus lubricantis]
MSLDVFLRHRFPDFSADVSFSAPAPGVTALFGPSGCGKSTVLSAVSGLLRADEVRVVLDGIVLSDLPPERRRIGVVFQEGRLFPHLSVRDNLRYGLRRAPPGPIDPDETVELLGIGHLLKRYPATLSGGERQRVAIGRALLSQPRLLVMDEPLAALDAARKAEILPYLARLRDSLRTPVLYVSHAMEEVARLADTLVLMEAGRVIGCGPVGEIAARADLPLALGNDAGAIIPAEIAAHDDARALTVLRATGGAAGASSEGARFLVPRIGLPPGSRLRIRIPASDVVLALERPARISANNVIPGTVRAVREAPGGRLALVEIAVGDSLLLSQLTPDSVAQLEIEAGKPVLALFKSIAVQVL